MSQLAVVGLAAVIAMLATGCKTQARTHLISSSHTSKTGKRSNDISQWMASIWKGGVMYEESLFLWGKPEEEASAPLLFDAREIISVQDSSLTTQYEQGTDWRYEGGKLVRPQGSRMPWTSTAEMYPENAGQPKPKNTLPRVGGGFLLFREGSFIHDKQVVVTYRHAPGVWVGPVPAYDPASLPKTFKKLQARSPVKIVAYGDSITFGYSASSAIGSPPRMPIWPELFRQSLQNAYGAPVELTNKAVGGTGCSWGAKNAAAAFTNQHPDLVVIGFGMNDRLTTTAELFDANTRKIMEAARAENPEVEFILIESMQNNPQWQSLGNLAAFGEKLTALKRPGVAVADMMSMHAALLRKKRYEDMTGNMVNHPNDFLVRVYAQVITAMLVNCDAKP